MVRRRVRAPADMQGRRAAAVRTNAIVSLGLSVALAAGSGCSSNSGSTRDAASACKDDRAPAGTVFVQGGQSCTLPDGRPGVGAGAHGCVDPAACHCNPAAGSAICAPGAVCVYAACSGVNQGEPCALAGGARGTCCEGVCAAQGTGNDPANCGGCGNACPVGATCSADTCDVPSGAAPTCAPGTIASSNVCHLPSCVGCITVSCAGIPNGAPCAPAADAGPGADPVIGICCDGACAVYDNDQNCGGCGVTCCPGSHCSPRDSTGQGGVCV